MENDKFEILFWKVFHNKYIVSTIFKIIESTEWVVYKDFQQISFKNKKKFKNIQSLEWMIKQKQYPLLKCKLECKDELVHINTAGITSLFKIGSTIVQKRDYNKPEPPKPNIQEETILLNHLLSLLLKYRWDEMVKFNLITIAIGCENLEAIKILTNQQYRVGKLIQPCESILNYSISNSVPSIVDYLIIILTDNNTTPISEVIKNQSIFLAFKNDKRKQMIKYILNNQLYTIPSHSSSSSFPTKIDICQLLSVPSNKIQNKLFQLNYYNQIKPDQIADIKNIDKETIINIMLSNIDNEYILFLKDIIKSKHDSILSNLSINRSINLEYIKFYTSIPGITFNSSTIQNIKSFILSTKDETSYKQAIEAISPLSIYAPIESQQENTMFLRDIFPSTWNVMFSKFSPATTLNLQDFETIDWLAENVQLLTKRFPFTARRVHFKTYQLIDYAITKGLGHLFSDTSFYRYPFFVAIGECDIDSLKYITGKYDLKLEYKDFRPGEYEQYHRAIKVEDKSIDQINRLNEYLNGGGFSFFPISLWQNYIETITSSFIEGYDISSVKIDFIVNSKFYEPSIRYFSYAISQVKPKKLRFYLNNNFNPILTHCDHVARGDICRYFSNIIYSTQHGKNIPKLQQNNHQFQNLLECIEIFINLYKSVNTMDKDSIDVISVDGSSKTEILSMYDFILNYLFKKLIQNKTTTIDQVQYVYKLIQNGTSIEIEHSIYHSIHYLGIKSKKLIKYIMDLPFLISISQVTGLGNEVGFKCDVNYDTFKGYNLGKYLQSTIFTYEYIFDKRTSFEQLLDHLIQQLSISPPLLDSDIIKHEKDMHNQDYCTTTLNFNLNYFLSIHRVDLFFNHLNMIYNIQSVFFSSSSCDTGCFDSDIIKQEPTLLNYSFIKNENCNCFINNSNSASNNYIYHFDGKELKISNSIYYKSCKIMTESDFNQFIKFNSYHSFINMLKSPFIKKPFLHHCKNQINHILLNHLKNINNNNNDNSFLIDYWKNK